MELFRNDAELGAVYARRIVIDENGGPMHGREHALHRGWVLSALFKENFVCFSSVMLRRSVLEDIGGFDEELPLAEDFDLLLRVAERYRFEYIDEPLVSYRTGHANLSQREEECLFVDLGIMDRFWIAIRPVNSCRRPSSDRPMLSIYLQLGLLIARRSRIAALRWYLRALAQRPMFVAAWKELIKLPMPLRVQCLMRRVLRRAATE